MKFEEIILHNFGVYHGTVRITLPQDPEKNICLIDGNNGFGKTTIMNGVEYCLYGIKEKFTERFEFINHYALKSDKPSMSVELKFFHNGKKYQLKRSVKSLTNEVRTHNDIEETLSLLENDKEVKNVDNRINEILPCDASQFFIFDGEKIKQYATLENPKTTREAIELVLGIPTIRHAIDDLQELSQKITLKRQQEMKKSKSLEKMAEDEQRILKILQEKENKLKTAEKKRTELLAQKTDVETNLSNYDLARECINSRNILLEKKKNIESRLDELRSNEKKEIKKIPLLILEKTIFNINKEIQDKNKKNTTSRFDKARLTGVIEELTQLTKQERCFCGNKIGLLEKNHLENIIDSYKNILQKNQPDGDNELFSKIQQFDQINGLISGIEIDFTALEKQKEKLLFELSEIDSELTSLSKKIGNVPVDEITKQKVDYEKLVKAITMLEENIKWYQNELEGYQSEKNTIEAQINRLKTIDAPNVSHFNKQLDLIQKSLSALNFYLDELVRIKKQQIQREGTIVFRRLTNKKELYDRVSIKDDYTLHIIDHDGIEIDNEGISAGEKQILALSFIAGLNRSTEKKAPVLMDTPFGRLDHEHKTNVMEFLHDISDQVMIFTTDEDVNEENIDLIKNFIGNRYKIEFIPDLKSSKIVRVI
jgi:DNA sulfur modification protein DndD